MAQNPFLLPVDDYKRSINPVKDWAEQTAFYASKMLNKPYADCLAHIRKKLKDKTVKIDNPTVVCYERADNGDKEKVVTNLGRYLKNTFENNEILAATGTTYLHPSVKESVIVELLDRNVAGRKKYKKMSQAYEAKGLQEEYKYYHQMQDAKKRANNSVSGGFVAEGSVINNKTAHSTLTSTTRSIASLSNASNERLVEGNRHYYTPTIALNNLIAIASTTDHALVAQAIQQYGLVYPSVEQTMACIRRSTDLYFRDRNSIVKLTDFVARLSDTERAAIVYTGDFYHLRELNPVAIRAMVTALSRRGDTTPMEDPVKAIYATDEQIVNYAHQINMSMMRGKGKEYAEMPLEEQLILANTCRNIELVLEDYRLFLKAFFLTKNSPCTIATIQSMVRRSVVLSDTDSTMFSCDSWVDWYFGGITFSDDGYAVAGAVMYMATQAIAHILALFSANMNVEKKRLFTLAMKPEYVFPVFAQTSVAKHYYTAMIAKEGNVFKDIKMEIKGVHMKDSTVPTNIIEGAAKEMENNIRDVMAGRPLRLKAMIEKTIAVEHEILRSLYAGESTYLKRFKIKEATAYKKGEEESPFQYYTLWQVAFAKKYGNAPKLPYNAVRIPLELANKTAVKEWFESLANDPACSEVGSAIHQWFVSNNKSVITSFPIPTDNCKMSGVPEELKRIMDAKKIVLVLTKSYRNILESMGYFPKHDYLVSELNGVPLPT